MIPNHQHDEEPTDVAHRFDQALRAAVHSGAKLDLGKSDTDPSQGDFGAVGGSAAYVEAYELFQKTQRIDLVLDSLTLRRTIDEDLSRMMRPVWMYLALLVLVATLGLVLFTSFTAPRIAAIRNDMQLMPAVVVSDSWVVETIPVALLVGLSGLAIALAGLAFSTKASAWVAMCFGGARYRADRLQAMNAVVEKANVEGASASPSSVTPSSVTDSTATDSTATGLAARLSLIAMNRTLLANDRLVRMRVSVPMLVVALVGGGGVLLFAFVVFAPLVVMIRDMAAWAADQGVWP